MDHATPVRNHTSNPKTEDPVSLLAEENMEAKKLNQQLLQLAQLNQQ
jgi:hypothetical protein